MSAEVTKDAASACSIDGKSLWNEEPVVYVVEVDHFIETATIHLIGGCMFQNEADGPLATREVDWSYPISSLREARDFALLARQKFTDLCEFCEQNRGFGV